MNGFKFAQPQFLWSLLLVVPALIAFFFWTWRVKQKLIAQFVQSRLLANLTVGVSQRRQKFRLVLLVSAVTFLLLALARPQWGFDWEEAKQQGLDILVAIDTSRSMLAEDVPPNRLMRAKLAALDLMRQAKNDRLGLVAFAGSAFLQSPLTLDEEAFRQSVDTLNVGIISQGGTALADAIETAQAAFETNSANHKVLVLFTDGEDHDADTETLAAAEKAAKAGMKIFTIGVGTAEGEMLRVKDDQGNLSFIKDDDGNAVKSHLNETLLQKIATAANGFYLPLRGANPMETLYARGLAPLPKSDSTTKLTQIYRERFPWPLSAAMACLIFEMFLPERRRVRRTKAIATASNPELQKAATIALLLFVPLIGMSSPSSALREYQSGKFEDALKEYENLSDQKTNDYRLHYNAGTAAYQAKQLDAAEKHLNAVLSTPEITQDLDAQERTYYNLGNTLFQRGVPQTEPDKKKEAWEKAIENYEHALRLNTNDIDATNNLQFVQKKLEELKQQQQQQQKNKGDKSKDKDQKDQQQQDQKDQNKDNKDKQDQKNSQEQKDASKKDQNSEKQQANKSDEEKKKAEQQAQAKKDKEKQDKQAQQKQAAKKGDKSDEKPEDQMEAAAAGQMTPQQAKQFLDAQKQDEKTLVFAPENKPKKPQTRKFKDW